VATGVGEARRGLTVSSVTSPCMDPPCLLLGINVTSATRGGDSDPSVNFQGSLRTLPQF